MVYWSSYSFLHLVPGFCDGFWRVVRAESVLQIVDDESLNFAPVGEGKGTGYNLQDQDQQQQEEELGQGTKVKG